MESLISICSAKLQHSFLKNFIRIESGFRTNKAFFISFGVNKKYLTRIPNN